MKAILSIAAVVLPTLAQAGELGQAEFGYWICLRQAAERHIPRMCTEPAKLATVAERSCADELATVREAADRQGFHPEELLATTRLSGRNTVREVIAESCP